MEELLKLTKENNKMLKKILDILHDMTSDDARLQNYAANFGIGIVSNIVGDRILGL